MKLSHMNIAILAMMLGASPAVAQEVGQPAAAPTPAPARSPAQQLIHDAANGQPVRTPDSMTAPDAAPTPPASWSNDRRPFVAVPLASDPPGETTPPAEPAGDEAGAPVETETDAIERRVAALRPGQFIWMPERATRGAVVLVVSLAEQMVYAYRGGELIGVSTVSSGRASHPTPTGSFTILQKRRRHFSNLYNNAPMPNMQRLTWDGIAFHAGTLPGYPASHGCIRLPMAFSNHLFGATSMGGRVHIIAESPPSATGALAYAAGSAGEVGTR